MHYCYEVIPDKPYQVIRNCSGCGCTSVFVCTGKFRVNANGKHVDVWLIYQCEKCKHSLNLSVLRRTNPSAVSKDVYKGFQNNDMNLVLKYGCDKNIFIDNQAEIDYKLCSWQLKKLGEVCDESTVVIYNPFSLKIRHEKILEEILGLSRCEAQRQLKAKQWVKVPGDDCKIIYRKLDADHTMQIYV